MNINGVVANNKKFCSWTGSDSLPLRLPLLSVSEEHTICQHATILNGMCVVCDKLMDDSYGVCFDYIEKGLRYSIDEISRLKKRNTKNLLRMRKLHLVLDLDHTLLHSRLIGKLTSDEKYLEKAAAATGEFSSDKISRGNDLFKIKIGDNVLLVKSRPFVRSFLEEASRLFEISVCAMGNREYATRAVKLLDPDCKYFNSRIITREDFKQKERKCLDLVLGQESSIVIVDDTESVWGGRVENLITVGSYDFFKVIGKNSEQDSDGVYYTVRR
ncbi:RNA polymerase II C-terminal domain phosphatase-like 4 [Citrus clementina]|uniref:RNA polymerase II C-terminal domain phosphatase-like 4 n=1 Tax=Citrus clementina TaxID=85681 RepID=UPI000CED261A|nr:RNA polymerase II C-terminal domain phosphatase-like 4 [Citrus x clementina]